MTLAEEDAAKEVLSAARVLSGHGLVDAFGHVSVRVADAYVVTPPVPLRDVRVSDELIRVPLHRDPPESAPGEAWLHTAIYRARDDARAVVRAQPPSGLPAAALPGPWRPVHGQAALLGPQIAVHDDARLARSAELAGRVVTTLGGADVVVLRGNGAVTVDAADAGSAVAKMWLVEAAARVRIALTAAGDVRYLSEEEVNGWHAVSRELLNRIWTYLLDGSARPSGLPA